MNRRSQSTTRIVCSLVMVALAPAVGSCIEDPVHDQAVAALGNEVPGVAQGPYHRAGEPCTVCHGPEGPASTQFSMAGTIFTSPLNTSSSGMLVGLGNVQVLLVDSTGSSPSVGSVITNCVGNFYITPEEWTPSFPVLVGLQSGTTATKMTTQISRATSCAQCHANPPSPSTVGNVYFDVAVDPDEEHMCPVSVTIGGQPGAVP
jgi:cytochrome c553